MAFESELEEYVSLTFARFLVSIITYTKDFSKKYLICCALDHPVCVAGFIREIIKELIYFVFFFCTETFVPNIIKKNVNLFAFLMICMTKKPSFDLPSLFERRTYL